MHGVKRVLVFCILIVILPVTLIIIPLYMRRSLFAEVTYPVAESDIIEIRDGISSIFCQQHSLRMSTNFNAFQLRTKPEISTNRKHIRLKKSMTLPDDTLEYWGFYLMKGASVHLKFCSRYDGSRILVVKGDRELKTCGLLDHNKNKLDANLAQGHEMVKVFFEDMTVIAESSKLEDGEKKSVDKKRSNADTEMEEENHGGEDLSDDGNEDEENVEKHETSTVVPRKKLKKGSYSQMRERQTESVTGNNLKVGVEQQVKENSEQFSTTDSTKAEYRPRRHLAEVAANASTNAESDLIRRKKQLYNRLYKRRVKREHVYDRKYSHGGNAVNFTQTDESNSISSFENGLFECYNGAILLAEGFPPSSECVNAHFLENGSNHMLSKHEITENGYYYYIFYSDNDLVRNDIHAIFDIYKPTFQYSNLSNAPGCVNATNCTFPISFLSDDIVIVEVPTRDGIEHEEDDITHLISTCHPRTEIYAIFPITVLILILSCSFL